MNRNIIFIWILAALPMYAQQEDPVQKDEAEVVASSEKPKRFKNIGEITISARKAETTNEQTVTRSEIREEMPADIGSAAASVPGVEAIRKGGIATDLNIRGSRGDNVGITMEDMVFFGAGPRRMDPPGFHADFMQVKKLSLIRGPYDVRHPGATAGNLDIHLEDPEAGLHGGIRGLYGSYQNMEGSGSLSWASPEKEFFSLGGYSHRQSNVYTAADGKTVTDIYGSDPKNQGYQPQYLGKDQKSYAVDTGWASVGSKPDKQTTVSVYGSYQNSGTVLYPYLLMDATEDRLAFGLFRFERKNIMGLSALRLKASYADVVHKMDNQLRSGPSSMNKMQMETNAYASTWSVRLSTEVAAKNSRWDFGMDSYGRFWRADNRMQMTMGMMQMDLMSNLIPSTRTTLIGLWGEYATYLSENNYLLIGMRLDGAEVKPHEDNSAILKQFYSDVPSKAEYALPSANAQWVHSLDEKQSIFWGAGIKQRVPDGLELFSALNRPCTMMVCNSTSVGNPGLKPEARLETDIGYTRKSQRLEMDARVYGGRIFNAIVPTALNTEAKAAPGNQHAQSYTNRNTLFAGSEIGLRFRIYRGFSWNGNLSYVRLRLEKALVSSDKDYPEVAPLNGRMGLRWDSHRRCGKCTNFYAELFTIFAARQNAVNTDLNEAETPAWATLNFKAGTKHEHWSVQVILHNLLNEQYYSHLSYLRDPFASGVKLPEPGLNFSVQAEARL